jgi:photosystem II stability/assembly factor-like uncharacterized protein
MSATVTPLAQDNVAVGESPDPQHIPLNTPSIMRLASGAYEQGGEQRLKGEPWAFILTSDDHGKTWQQSGRAKVTHGRLLVAGNAVCYLGHSAVLVGRRPEDRSGDLRILRSDDAGTTWVEAVDFTHGDGNDLVILSRSGDTLVKSAHDGNLITFHRVKNFRELVY